MAQPESAFDEACKIAQRSWSYHSRRENFSRRSINSFDKLCRLACYMPETSFVISFMGSLHLASDGINSGGIILSMISSISAASWGIKEYIHRQQIIWDNLTP